jgi:Mu transposase-like protein
VLLPFVNGISRKVTPKCTISIGRSTYASTELKDLRGSYVDVKHDPEDNRIVYVSHPSLKGLIDCQAVSSDVKYATDANDALMVGAIKNLPAREIQREADLGWGKLDESVERREAKLKAAKRKRQRKQQPVTNPPTEASLPDNVVTFRQSQGGMVRLKLAEGRP